MGKLHKKKNKAKVASKPKSVEVEKVNPEAAAVEEKKATVAGGGGGKKNNAVGGTITTTVKTSATTTTTASHAAHASKGTTSNANNKPCSSSNANKPCNSSNSATSVITTKGGTIPDGFVSSGEEDVFKYSDISHTSVIKKVHGYFKGTLRGALTNKAFNSLTHKVITTSCEVDPVIKVLEAGVDLAEAHDKPWCCFGSKNWNCRHYAHELSTNFSRYSS